MPSLKKYVSVLLVAVWLLAAPSMSSAQNEERDESEIIPTLHGYEQGDGVYQEGASTALTYMLLVALTAVGIAVMFKDARRTHLD